MNEVDGDGGTSEKSKVAEQLGTLHVDEANAVNKYAQVFNRRQKEYQPILDELTRECVRRMRTIEDLKRRLLVAEVRIECFQSTKKKPIQQKSRGIQADVAKERRVGQQRHGAAHVASDAERTTAASPSAPTTPAPRSGRPTPHGTLANAAVLSR